jgi:hypothetical protein
MSGAVTADESDAFQIVVLLTAQAAIELAHRSHVT